MAGDPYYYRFTARRFALPNAASLSARSTSHYRDVSTNQPVMASVKANGPDVVSEMKVQNEKKHLLCARDWT